MAQYFRDFSEYPAGLNPQGWTMRWATTQSFYAIQHGTGSIGDSWLAHSNTDTGNLFHFFSFDEGAGPIWPSDVEVLVRFQTASSPSAFDGGIMLRGSGAANSKNGVFFVLEEGNFATIYLYDNNAEIYKADTNFLYIANEWLWMRFRITGDQFQAKVWRGTVGQEPAGWMVQTSDARVPNPGWIGLFTARPAGDRFWDLIGVGTGGDQAPSEPVAPSSELEGVIAPQSNIAGSLFVESPGVQEIQGEITGKSAVGGGLRVPVETEDREIHSRIVFLRNPEIDVTPWVTRVEVNLGNVSSVGTGSSGGDGVVRQAFVTIQNDNANRFSPLDATSEWNYDGLVFDPLIRPDREMLIYTAEVSIGQTPSPGDYDLLFHGIVGDSIRTEGQVVEIECRDLAKRLQERYILEYREYGAPIEDGGVPAHVVMQQILDDEFGAGVIDLYVPVPPSFALPPFAVEFGTVWDWLQDITAEFGWFLGYKYDPVMDQFRLTLLEPPRGKTAATADWQFDGDDVFIQDLDITDRDIRNRVAVVYRNEAGVRQTVTVNDAASQVEFGLRPMQIDETDTHLIKTGTDAFNLANLALQDLAGQRATNSLTLPFLPGLDLYDGITVYDSRVSSEVEFYGVESLRHTLDFAGERLETEVIAAGRVIGSHQRWLQMQAREGSAGNPPNAVWPVRPNTVLTVAAYNSNDEGRRRADIVCTGQHDQRDINRALQRVGVGGKVSLLEGDFNITDSIIIPSNRQIEGQGESTIIFLDGVFNDFFFMFQNEDVVNGNTNITISNLRLDGNAPAHVQDDNWWHYGVYLERCQESVVQNLNIADITGYGVFLLWSHNSKVVQNKVSRCKVHGISVGGDDLERLVGATITNNIVTDCISDLFWLTSPSTGIGADAADNLVISNNVVTGNDQGISIVFIEESTISGNSVANNIFPGLWVWRESNHNVISGNNCAYNGFSGIFVQGDDNIISGNDSIGSGQFPTAPAPPGYNIEIDGLRNNVQGNTVRVGDGTFEPVGGIYISSLSEDSFVTNNDLLDGGAGGNLLEDNGLNTETRPGNRPNGGGNGSPSSYHTDFTNWPLDETPYDWRGWHYQDYQTQVYIVMEDGAPALLVANETGTLWRIWGPKDAPAARNIEIFSEFKITATSSGNTNPMGVWMRVSGWNDARLGGLYVAADGTTFSIKRRSFTGYTTLDSQSGLIATNTWYKVRFRAEGQNLFAKIWLSGDPEPVGWTLQATQPAGTHVTGARIGLGNGTTTSQTYFRQFGYAIAGETAPGN